MNSILQPRLRNFVVLFLDDILAFSRTWAEHAENIRTVLETLRTNQLYCKRSKCELGVKEVFS